MLKVVKALFQIFIMSFSILAMADLAIAENSLSPFVSKSEDSHFMQILSNGTAAFARRLSMIENAKSSIEIEYFIYNTDEAGKIFTQTLIKKAKEGVRVRILVDASSLTLELDDFYAKELARFGIEVRYYNTAFTLRPKAILYRNHRKLIVVDDEFSVVGGRNIANEYFDLSSKYNFLDRDVFVQGSVSKSMRETFDYFWNSDMVDKAKLKRTREPKVTKNNGETGINQSELQHEQWLARVKMAKDFVTEDAVTLELKDKILEVGGRILKQEPLGVCSNVVFATDRPGTTNNRILWNHLMGLLNDTQESLTADTPYFILKNDGVGFLKNMLNRGVDVRILTNSLYSTDAFYTIPVFKNRIKAHIRNGAKVYVYKGEPLEGEEFVSSSIRKSRWGVHAKTAVFDHRSFMIGTFNVDPRSKNLNTELALFCNNSNYLASAVEADINRRINAGVQLNRNGEPVDGRGTFYGAKLPKRLMYHILAPLTHIFDGLL